MFGNTSTERIFNDYKRLRLQKESINNSPFKHAPSEKVSKQMSKSIFEINLCNPIIDNSNLNNSLSPGSKALIENNSEIFEN